MVRLQKHLDRNTRPPNGILEMAKRGNSSGVTLVKADKAMGGRRVSMDKRHIALSVIKLASPVVLALVRACVLVQMLPVLAPFMFAIVAQVFMLTS